MKKLILAAVLCLPAFSQTVTYDVPVGATCSKTINGCTLFNLTTSDPGALTTWGWFVGGTYYTQFDFQIYQGQNAAGGATYCEGNAMAYTQTARPDLGANYSEWKLACTANAWTNGTGSGELGNVGPWKIAVDLVAHSYQQRVKACSRSGCYYYNVTVWAIDNGTVALTPVK
jgi:hypothetical protein